MERVIKATLPFYVCMIITLLMITFIPAVSLWRRPCWARRRNNRPGVAHTIKISYDLDQALTLVNALII